VREPTERVTLDQIITAAVSLGDITKLALRGSAVSMVEANYRAAIAIVSRRHGRNNTEIAKALNRVSHSAVNKWIRTRSARSHVQRLVQKIELKLDEERQSKQAKSAVRSLV
jgi:hypothetical protein